MPGAEHAGDLRVVDIGFPDDLVRSDAFLTEPTDVVRVLPVRSADTHKRSSGVLLIVAGSRGMTGAVKLIAGAAGRLGTGLVTVAVPRSILPIVQSAMTEATFLALAETPDGTVAAAALDAVLEAVVRADALAVGPGLTTQEETSGFVRDLVRACPVPMIVDADGLNAFSGRADAIADRKSDAVLTPHAGEFARLSGVPARELDADRLAHVRALAARADSTTLLKGSRTLIVSPDGVARVNPTGSAVLATAGSGDVLTGMIGGLLARGVGPGDAATAGAYVHGVAGLLAGQRAGEGTVAGDLVEALPQAVARVRERG